MSVVIPAGYEAVTKSSVAHVAETIEQRIAQQHQQPLEVAPQPAPSTVVSEEKPMSLKSILDDVGSGFKKFFTGAEKVAVVAEPFVDIAFPGVAPLYNTTVSAVGAAENAAIAAGVQTGSGPQKLAMVTASIESSFNSYWASLGHTTSPAQSDIENYVNAVVATLNAIPAPPVPVN